jgi:hypothetical protein
LINKLRHEFLFFIFRQADFLHEIATIYESVAGIEQWWIGLTDLGMYHYREVFFTLTKFGQLKALPSQACGFQTQQGYPVIKYLTRIPSGESIWGSRSKKDRLLKNQ